MAQVFLLSTITGNGAESEQVNVILRHLNKRGNNVTLYGEFVFASLSSRILIFSHNIWNFLAVFCADLVYILHLF